MGMIDGDQPRFRTAAAAAAQILDQLVDGDQVALLPTCGPAFPDSGKLARTQDSVRQMLGECRVSYERANLRLKLQQARELLDKSEAPNKQIYILTDMQRASWDEGEGGRGKGTEGWALQCLVRNSKRGGEGERRRRGDKKTGKRKTIWHLLVSPSPPLPLSLSRSSSSTATEPQAKRRRAAG